MRVRLAPGFTFSDLSGALAAAGFRLTAVSALEPSIGEGYLPLWAASAAAAVPGVARLTPELRPHTRAGAVQSQAVAVEKADLAQARGVDGRGIRVGVLSDSFASITDSPNAQDDVASGDLPAEGVTVLEDLPVGAGTDEGRAMCQLVHDLAPGAALAFATAFNGEVDFSNNILALRRQFGADVIVDDVIYTEEPMYSDGLLARTVDQVAREGAAYFSSAGNNGIEAYEAVFRPVSPAAAQALVAAGTENVKLDQIAGLGFPTVAFHDFGGGRITQRFSSLLIQNLISAQWDDLFDQGPLDTLYNVYVFDLAGNLIPPGDINDSSAAAPDVAGVAALVLQAAGGPGSLTPARVYKALEDTAVRVPVADDRANALAFAGPVLAAASGDIPFVSDYYRLAVQPFTRRSVASVSIDVGPSNLFFLTTRRFPFALGDSSVGAADVTETISPDGTVLTLTFAPGALRAGGFVRFGILTLTDEVGFIQTTADRLRNAVVTVTLDNGATATGTFFTGPQPKVNRFSGAGIVDADAAVRDVARRR